MERQQFYEAQGGNDAICAISHTGAPAKASGKFRVRQWFREHQIKA